MANVFLSYAIDDQVKAEEIVGALKAAGYDIHSFTSPEKWGERFTEKISSELRSCTHFVSLISPSYLASRVCQAEFQAAFAIDRLESYRGRSRFSIFIVDIERVDEDQLIFERIYDRLDLVGTSNCDLLVNRLKRAEKEVSEK